MLLIGIIVGVYLVRFQQIFKSRANEQIYNVIEVNQTNDVGETKRVECQGNNCNTDSLDIEFKVNIKSLEDQINSQE